MAKTAQRTVRIDVELDKRAQRFSADTGVTVQEQIRRGLDAWLTEQEQFRAQLKGSLKLAKGGR